MPTPFEVLGVATNATNDEIRRAYRIKAQILHPDRHATASAEIREAAAEEFRRVAVAYESLTKPDQGSARFESTETGWSQNPSNDRQDVGADSSDRSYYGAGPEEIISFAVSSAAQAHPEFDSAPQLVRSYMSQVYDGTVAQLATVGTPWGWDGNTAVGFAHMALYQYMNIVAAELSKSPASTHEVHLYLIAFNACLLIDHVTEPPPGLPLPVPLAARLPSQSRQAASRSASDSRNEVQRLGAGRAVALVAAGLGLIILIWAVVGGAQYRQSVSSPESPSLPSMSSSRPPAQPTWRIGGCVKPVPDQPDLLEPAWCRQAHTGKVTAVTGKLLDECPAGTFVYAGYLGFLYCIEPA